MDDAALANGRDSESPTAPRLLETLERLLELPSADLKTTLSFASDLVADATGADKVDAFLYDSRRDSLVAVGTSDRPLSARQRKLGLDILPVSNGGRVVHVYRTGQTFVSGNLQDDSEELRGIKESLGIHSKVGVPLVVAGTRRGMMMLASLQPNFFTADDVRFAEAVSRWIATVAHRAELVEEISRNAAEQGRRAAAEELVTVVAHDLRNFLAPLDGQLHLLHRRAQRERRDADLADLGAAQQALGRLRNLVSDILDVARIEHGLFHTAQRPFNLVALIRDTARTLGSLAHPVAVHVEAADTLMVSGDEARLRQCLENLIANAIQKSPKEAPVNILVASETRADGEWALVEVVDQGPGVPDHLLPHIFERYTSGTHREGGLGLGLYLAKQIAAMHNGDVAVSSTPGKGARFVLALPCCPDHC
jgi:two-component system, OmpR family, sensor kinase